MAAFTSRLPIDRVVRYAVSDALASVKSQIDDLEYNQRRSNQEIATWKNYLSELRALHQWLLNLPSLETAEWLTDAQVDQAPTFTPFVSGVNDARTNIRRVYKWLLSLSNDVAVEGTSDEASNSVVLEQQQYYVHQIDQVLTQLQLMPRPGSDEWYSKYEPAAQQNVSSSSQELVSTVAR